MTIGAAAQRAGVSTSVIRQARVDGRFPAARRGPAVGRREAPWLISSEDLDAAGFIAATTGTATPSPGRPYLEQQVDLLRQSLDVLLEHVESQADDLRIVADGVCAIRVVIAEHLGAVAAIPHSEDLQPTKPLLVRVLGRLRNLALRQASRA